MIKKLTDKITKKYIVISFVLLIILGFFMLGIFSNYFSANAGGYPYMETKLFYTPSDLFDMAEGYGTSGRTLYMKSALSLDLLVPLLAGNFLTSLALYLSNKKTQNTKMQKKIVALGICVCSSDWIENLFMISVLQTYPQKIMVLAVMGRIMTSAKYLLMLIFVFVIIYEIYHIKVDSQNISS